MRVCTEARYSRPRDRRKALQHILGEVLSGEVAVLEQGAGLNLDVTNGSELLDKGSEGVQRADGL